MAKVTYLKKVSDINVRMVLQRIAAQMNRNIRVHSGNRGFLPKGSSKRSLHLRHRAADFHVLGVSDRTSYSWLKKNYDKIFDVDEAYEMIHHWRTGTEGEHLHLGRYGNNRKGYVDFKLEFAPHKYQRTRWQIKNNNGNIVKPEIVSGITADAIVIVPPIGIFDSVGLNSQNNDNDVRLIQILINRASKRLKEAKIPLEHFIPLIENGALDELTAKAIVIFQRDAIKFNNPDGRVDPGGKTIRALYVAAYGSTEKIVERFKRIRTLKLPNEKKKAIFGWNGTLAWGNHRNVTSAFVKKTIQVSNEIGIKNPGWLMTIMAFETGESFAPNKRNMAGSSGTGLIQFMRATINGQTKKGKFYPGLGAKLGIRHSDLAKMSAIRQLDIVKAYFQQFGSKPRLSKDIDDLYFLVLSPRFWGKSDDTTMFKGGTLSYKQNKGLDTNRDQNVSVGETAQKIRNMYKKGMSKENGLKMK